MPQRNEGALRLQVRLARAGLGSRRACEDLIRAGRVRVDGHIVRELGTRVSAGSRVEVDGRRVVAESHVYLAVHKPAGYVCSNRRMDARPIVSDLYRAQVPGRLFHVGRLDALSSGLILVTNDGDFANTVTHPSREVEKEYLVDTVDAVSEGLLGAWKRGLTIDGVRYVVRAAERHSPTRMSLTLTEGRNREIRRILEASSIKMRSVHRVRIGPVRLRGLRPGAFRPLTTEEIRSLGQSRPAPRPRRGATAGRRARLVHKNAHPGPTGP